MVCHISCGDSLCVLDGQHRSIGSYGSHSDSVYCLQGLENKKAMRRCTNQNCWMIWIKVSNEVCESCKQGTEEMKEENGKR